MYTIKGANDIDFGNVFDWNSFPYKNQCWGMTRIIDILCNLMGRLGTIERENNLKLRCLY